MQLAEATIFIVVSILLLRINRKWRWPLLVVFLGVVYYLTVGMRNPTAQATYNTTLFAALQEALAFNKGLIQSMLTGDVVVENKDSLVNIILNFLMFVPVGYLFPMVAKGINRWWKTLLIGLLLSLAIEITQLCTHLGYAEIDDLLDNTLGTVFGWILYMNFIKPTEKKQEKQDEVLRPIDITIRSDDMSDLT